MKNVFTLYLLTQIIFCVAFSSYCQLPDDNRRYFGPLLINDDETATNVDVIQEAYNRGMNAVYLTARWDAIQCPDCNCNSMYWTQLDSQVNKAISLGMKVAFRIHLHSADVNRLQQQCYRSDNLWGTPTAANMQGLTSSGIKAFSDGYYNKAFPMTNQTAINNGKAFISAVINRYSSQLITNNSSTNKLLFVSVTTNSQQEAGYPFETQEGAGKIPALFDYSDEVKQQYRTWHQFNYGNQVDPPQDFILSDTTKAYLQDANKRWYIFRHKILKDFLTSIAIHIKGINPNIKVINDFGSVFDNLSVRRGTLGFKDLGSNTDGIKINDAHSYNHHFSMDLLRTNLPNKWIMNEAYVDNNPAGLENLVDESFQHGAKFVCIVTPNVNTVTNIISSQITNMANKWISGTNGNMTAISTNSVDNKYYNLSNILSNVQKYDFTTYTQPRAIFLNEDLFCSPPSAPIISPNNGSVCASTNQTVTLNSSGCSGTVTWSNGQTGSSLVVSQPNTYTATCTVNNCTSGSSNTATITQASGCGNEGCSNNGSISYEKWNNIGIGGNISDFRSATNNLTTTPNLTQSLTLFEAPSNIDDQYGARIRGYVCAPVSGNYTFWIAGDDGCELWLSSDDNPANIQKIAYHNGSTGSQQWNVSSTQQSNTISLLAGQRYYIEALVKEGFGNDNLAVGWQLPNGTLERPILGNRLIPFQQTTDCNFSLTSASSSSSNPSCGASITLTAICSNCTGVNYTWSNGISNIGSSNPLVLNAPSTNGNTTYTVTASKAGCNNQTATTTITVNNCSPSSCLMNKVRLKFRDDCCLDRLQGAQIQGSSDGINWNNIYTINTNGTGEWQTFTFNTVTYPQVRFVSGPNGFGELREIEFYYNDTKLTGQGFGNGSQSANETWEKAMDDNLTNLWHGPWSPNWLPGVNNYVGLILNCNSTPSCSNTGSISYEKWNNIGIGSNISDFRSATNNLTTTPNLTQPLTLFEAPTNIDDQYGARIRGYVCAPVTGNYTFWIAGDDGCELWLSSDDNPANIQKIAYHNGSTGSQQWNVSSTQQSNTISLLAGQRYYIEALVKEGFGNDNLAVGWQLPNGTLERPILGNRLIPFGGSSRIGVEKESILLLEETSNSVQLYPNPNQGKVNLRYYLAKGEKANVTFVNVGGNIITQKTLVGEGVWKQDQTDLTSQPSGTYSLRFEAEGKLITRKFLIVK